MDLVRLQKVDEVYIKVIAEAGILMEMSTYFTFTVPNAHFMPAVREKLWDGKIRLLNVMNGYIYSGLARYIEEFCKSRNYELEYLYDNSSAEFSIKEAKDFIKTLNIDTKLETRDYQLEAFVHAVREKKSLLLSPTASGKSFIIYLLTRYYNARTLIIVPTTSLVSQLHSDFRDYGLDDGIDVHCIFSGRPKSSNAPITISTWQSLYKLPRQYFESFDVIIGDEAHLFKAKSLVGIMVKLHKAKYRFGFTGTLDGAQTHKLVLEGLFGPVKQVITTAELIEQKYLAKLNIKAIVLTYPDEVRQLVAKLKYPEELDYILQCKKRNRFIKNLALSLEGNTLILYQFVEKHGEVLRDMIKAETNRPVYFVAGAVEGEEREEIRKIVENETDAIIVASSGTFSTGVNIRNLHNIIFSSPSKARIKTLQSIGRGLRKSETKDSVTLYDIADDLTWKSHKNFTIRHFMERIKIYNEEQFPYKIYKVALDI